MTRILFTDYEHDWDPLQAHWEEVQQVHCEPRKGAPQSRYVVRVSGHATLNGTWIQDPDDNTQFSCARRLWDKSFRSQWTRCTLKEVTTLAWVDDQGRKYEAFEQ